MCRCYNNIIFLLELSMHEVNDSYLLRYKIEQCEHVYVQFLKMSVLCGFP